MCTANLCRSPTAAALFRRCCTRLEANGLWEQVSVASAGLLPGGYASPPEIVTALAELGLDGSSHCSTELTPELVAASDLVVGLARRHAREVVLLDGDAWPVTFTLRELVRRGEARGSRQQDETVDAWLARLHEGRQRTDLVGSSSEDDVDDPLGGPLDAYRDMARELGDLVDRMAGLLGAPRQIAAPPG